MKLGPDSSAAGTPVGERQGRQPAQDIKTAWERRAYPKLDKQKRRAVRRIFWFGLLHPDAMHWAIWGRNERRDEEASS